MQLLWLDWINYVTNGDDKFVSRMPQMSVSDKCVSNSCSESDFWSNPKY